MSKTNDFQNYYYNGIKALDNNDYATARYWLEITVNEPKYRNNSLLRLCMINLREGKYAPTREILENQVDSSDIRFKRLYGLLENIENNFETSKKYFSECLLDPSLQRRSLLSISKLYIQTGDNEVARKMLETLNIYKEFKTQTIIDLICLNILEKNYDSAYKLLTTIDKNILTPKLLNHYHQLNIYLLYLMGKLKDSNYGANLVENYTVSRLLDDSEEHLLKHIQRHKNQNKRDSTGCFFRDTNLKELLADAKDIIKELNPNHFEVSDFYRFRLDKPIGYKGKEITRDLCVATIIGSKEIISMYPVLLSSSFDKEGMSTSKQLKLKREQGGNK